MTNNEFIEYVRNMHNAIGDDNWSDDEILALARARSNEIISIIGAIESRDTISSVVDQESYAYPTNVIRIHRVRWDKIDLKLITFTQLNFQNRRGTAPPSGTPLHYLLWNNNILLSPIPGTIKDIDLFTEKEQGVITTGSGTIDIPSVLHTRLADGVLEFMFIKDENLGMGTHFQNKWIRDHIPAFREWKNLRRRNGSPITTTDVDSTLETELGVI